jgi:hypothetical protein
MRQHCLFCDLGRGTPTQFRMRPDRVVIVLPVGQLGVSIPLRTGRHHFFPVKSFNTALSSIASASSFFSLAFSSSSDRSRLASDTSILPNFDFHLQKVRRADPVLAADLRRRHARLHDFKAVGQQYHHPFLHGVPHIQLNKFRSA